jgi:hypothetical protein
MGTDFLARAGERHYPRLRSWGDRTDYPRGLYLAKTSRCLSSSILHAQRTSPPMALLMHASIQHAPDNHHPANVGDSGGNRAELWPESAKIGRSS